VTLPLWRACGVPVVIRPHGIGRDSARSANRSVGVAFATIFAWEILAHCPVMMVLRHGGMIRSRPHAPRVEALMVLGMSTSAFTLFHVVLSLIGIAAGVVVVAGMLGSKTIDGIHAVDGGRQRLGLPHVANGQFHLRRQRSCSASATTSRPMLPVAPMTSSLAGGAMTFMSGCSRSGKRLPLIDDSSGNACDPPPARTSLPARAQGYSQA
jgi:hypothetical protein